MTLWKMDKCRYQNKAPLFQYFFRKAQEARFFKLFFRIVYYYLSHRRHIDLSPKTKVSGGLYIGHPYNITINPNAVIGKNVNIHKGVTIGQENRGKRKGCPTISDNVWIGINATIVGNIKIGTDVLIAPNAYVNFDVPDHSIVIGNPGIIKSVEFATKDYINNTIE
ncbi:MAG: serine acetyltransferase [Erysipelotrichaceae bacterium]|nr:serine acetyltransferase [Erysipelotrichaceae bacterium]